MATVSSPLRLRGGVVRVGDRVSLRVRRRPIAVCGVLSLLLVVLFVFALGTGDFPIAPGEVISALLGGGDEGTRFIVRDLRLPRAVCAILV
ncbi:MAG: iron chelate uptake ABC transporter family permease subunit, partial [Solirubrobacterales bacterium]